MKTGGSRVEPHIVGKLWFTALIWDLNRRNRGRNAHKTCVLLTFEHFSHHLPKTERFQRLRTAQDRSGTVLEPQWKSRLTKSDQILSHQEASD